MESNQSSIAFTKDIARKLAKRMDMPVEKVEANIKTIMDVMAIKAEDPKRASMYLPKLGTMYFRVHYARKVVERLDRQGKKLSKFTQSIKDKMELHLPIVDYKRIGELQLKRLTHRSRRLNKGMSLKEIESFQNKKYNEFKKDQEYS